MHSVSDSTTIPSIVPIVLRQLAHLHAAGRLKDEEFAAKLDRLTREELGPRNLTLLVRPLADGSTRFLIKHRADDRVCDLLDCHPLRHDSDEADGDGSEFPQDPQRIPPSVTA